jgi:ferritin-like protein
MMRDIEPFYNVCTLTHSKRKKMNEMTQEISQNELKQNYSLIDFLKSLQEFFLYSIFKRMPSIK